MLAAMGRAAGQPAARPLGVDQAHGALQAGGNMEGKETRFGITASALFATITTAASCGAVNAMHDSFMPLGGLVPMLLIQLGEVVFGGVGTGLYGMLIFAIMAVFIAGLMIGRTPEYLGKKIQSFEMKMTSIAILVTPLLVLVGTAVAVMTEPGRPASPTRAPTAFRRSSTRCHSAANNNGSAFAGLSANTPFYNVLLAVVMWFGRFAFIVPVLAIAGSLAGKKRIDVTAGTLPTHGPLFIALLVGTVAAGRRADLRAGARARARDRTSAAARDSLRTATWHRKTLDALRSCADRPGGRRLVPQAVAARADPQSGDVRRLCRQHPDDAPVRPGPARQRRGPGRVHPRDHRLAVVHRAVRKFRRGARRRAQQGAGGLAARH